MEDRLIWDLGAEEDDSKLNGDVFEGGCITISSYCHSHSIVCELKERRNKRLAKFMVEWALEEHVFNGLRPEDPITVIDTGAEVARTLELRQTRQCGLYLLCTCADRKRATTDGSFIRCRVGSGLENAAGKRHWKMKIEFEEGAKFEAGEATKHAGLALVVIDTGRFSGEVLLNLLLPVMIATLTKCSEGGIPERLCP